MEAIAITASDDPFLRMSPQERIAARKARRERLWRVNNQLERDELPKLPQPSPEPLFVAGEWVARQKEIHKPFETWFSIEDEINPFAQKPPKIAEIQAATADFYKVRRSELLADRRTANIVKPRQVAMFLCKKLTLHSLPEIGRRFGGRDHTTIIHAVRKIETLCGVNTDLRDEVESVRSLIIRRAA